MVLEEVPEKLRQSTRKIPPMIGSKNTVQQSCVIRLLHVEDDSDNVLA
jgi:hypothetical protein